MLASVSGGDVSGKGCTGEGTGTVLLVIIVRNGGLSSSSSFTYAQSYRTEYMSRKGGGKVQGKTLSATLFWGQSVVGISVMSFLGSLCPIVVSLG
jgi:hypothetical protein